MRTMTTTLSASLLSSPPRTRTASTSPPSESLAPRPSSKETFSAAISSASSRMATPPSSTTTPDIPPPIDLTAAINKAGLALDAPLRPNGHNDSSSWNNGNSGNASIPGTRAANTTQQQWFADVTTQVLLPRFAAEPQ